MGREQNKLFGLLFLLLSSFSFLLVYYTDMVLSPNQFLFSNDGDGVKNYYALLYHIFYDESYHYFQGMNYPFSDLFIFSDGNPFLANVIKFTSSIYPPIREYSIGIYNYVILFSSIVTALYSWRTLRLLKVSEYIAVIGAFVITFMSPQWMRITGHLSLSVSFFIPAIIYYLVKWSREGNYNVSFFIKIVLFSVISIFTHVYLGVICALLILVYGVVYHLLSRNWQWKKWMWLIGLACFNLVVFKGYLFIFDKASIRPVNKDVWLSSFSSVFLPYVGGFREILKSIVAFPGREWESIAYVGVLTLPILVFLLCYFIWCLIKRRNITFFSSIPKQTYILLITGIVILFFSWGYFHWILGHIDQFSQVRVVARFAWGFYYCGLIVVWYFVSRVDEWMKVKYSTQARVLLLFFVTIFYMIDLMGIQNYYSTVVQNNTNEFRTVDTDIKNACQEIDTSDYQAIVGFPFYYVGGEYLGVEAVNEVELYTQVLSFQTGMPLVNSKLARTPVSQARKVISQFGSPFIDKKIKPYLDDKPYLLFYKKSNYPILNKFEKHWINTGEIIMESGDFVFMSLNTEDLWNKQKAIETIVPDTSLYSSGSFLTTCDDATIIENNFSEYNYESDSIDNEVFFTKEERYYTIAEYTDASLERGEDYVLSFWYFNRFPENKQFVALDQLLDNGEWQGWKDIFDVAISFDVSDRWTRVEALFSFKEDAQKVAFVAANDKKYPFIIDSLMIRPAGCDVYKKINDSLLYYNNYLIEIDKEDDRFDFQFKDKSKRMKLIRDEHDNTIWSDQQSSPQSNVSIEMNEDDLYSPTLEYRLHESGLYQINIGCDINVYKGQRESIMLVTQIEREDELVFRKYTPLDMKNNEFIYNIDIPGNIRDDDILKVFVFNNENAAFLVRSLYVDLMYNQYVK